MKYKDLIKYVDMLTREGRLISANLALVIYLFTYLPGTSMNGIETPYVSIVTFL